MRVGQVEQVEPAEQLHPPQSDQIDSQQRRDDSKAEGADEAVTERLLCSRPETEHHDRHDQRVGAEEAFEQHEKPDRQRSDVSPSGPEYREQLTRLVSRLILGSAQLL
jgi:hypothetical protein